MTFDEAELLYASMLEHRDVWPRGHEIHLLGRNGEHDHPTRLDNSRAARRQRWHDYGVGVHDPGTDTRINMWNEDQVDQVMSRYMKARQEARRTRRT